MLLKLKMPDCQKCDCSGNSPLFKALDTIAKRWSLLILMTIHNGEENYNAIQRAIPEINTRILSQRLKELETEGYIEKFTDKKNIRKTSYKLSQKSLDLKPIMMDMSKWAGKWDSKA